MKNLLSSTILIILFFAHANAAVSVLIGSPIRKSPAILKEFLSSLRQLKQDTITIDYFFIDDNDHETSSELLQEFAQETDNCIIIKVLPTTQKYICNEITHYWNDALVWKVAQFKNCIIQTALQRNYDYLFLVDSDLLLNPNTLEHLVATNKEIVSEIFWTRWSPHENELPNAWLSDVYVLTDEFLKQLRAPGTYSVGGLCGCTLINKKALKAGASFSKIHNLSFWGEDRHFCIRAGALGLSLFIDTHMPTYHIFRESELAGVEAFKKNNNLL